MLVQKSQATTKKAQIIYGITGLLFCSSQDIIDELKKVNPQLVLSELPKTFNQKQFLEAIVKYLSEANLTQDVLEMDDQQLQAVEEIVENSFVQSYDEQGDTENIRRYLDQWYMGQIFYPILNNFQYQLLHQRNYFHLICIETPTSQRYQNFKTQYPDIPINLSLFTLIDDHLRVKKNFVESCRTRSKVHISSLSEIQLLSNQIYREVRPQWQEYFMYMAHIVKVRSNCMKRAVGAVIVKRDRIIATGYNGTPYGKINCFEGGCQRCNSNVQQGQGLEKCFCFHAEENAILEIGTKKSQGASLYTTLFPCYQCTKIIIAAGIEKLYFEEDYNNRSAQTNLKEMIEIYQVNTQNYVH